MNSEDFEATFDRDEAYPWIRSEKVRFLLNLTTDELFYLDKGTTVIGRTPSKGIYLADPEVSRTHALITCSLEKALLSDQNSLRGTRLNGRRVHSRPMQHNDILQLGTSLLKFFEVKSDERPYFPDKKPAVPSGIIIGHGLEWQKMMAQIEKAARSELSVLILGETGVGKELVARSIFESTPHFKGCYKTCNITALSPGTIESSLFGHEKGAFTDAYKRHIGLIKECGHGTLFIDEIGDLDLNIQTKLLRAIQFGEIQPVGGSIEKIQIRFIAATNRSVQETVVFRKDLFERFGIKIFIPPLRERIEDIKILVAHFAGSQKEIGWDFMLPLYYYRWPGNIRELEFVIKNALNISQTGERLCFGHLDENVKNNMAEIWKQGEDLWFEDPIVNDLVQALKRNKGNVAQTATDLNLSRQTVYDYFKTYSINPEQYRKTK